MRLCGCFSRLQRLLVRVLILRSPKDSASQHPGSNHRRRAAGERRERQPGHHRRDGRRRALYPLRDIADDRAMCARIYVLRVLDLGVGSGLDHPRADIVEGVPFLPSRLERRPEHARNTGERTPPKQPRADLRQRPARVRSQFLLLRAPRDRTPDIVLLGRRQRVEHPRLRRRRFSRRGWRIHDGVVRKQLLVGREPQRHYCIPALRLASSSFCETSAAAACALTIS